MSNEAYGYRQSDAITIGSNRQVEVAALVRGELDPSSYGNVAVNVCYYNAQGNKLECDDFNADPNNETGTLVGHAFTTPTGTTSLRLFLEVNRIEGWVAFDDVTLSLQSAAVTSSAGKNYDLSAWVRGVMNAPTGQSGVRLRVDFYNSSGGSVGTQASVWSSSSYNQTVGDGQLQSGSFTTPVNTATFRVGLEVHLDNGWADFDIITLTGKSQTISAAGGEVYDLSALVSGNVTAPLGEGGAIKVHYSGGTPTPATLWSSPANYNSASGTTQTAQFTTPAGTTSFYIAYEVRLDNGKLTYNNIALKRLSPPAAPITRKYYSLGGQTIALYVNGDPEPTKNGLFYIYTDHLGSTTRLSTSTGSGVVDSEAYYLPFGGYRVTPTAGITDRGFTGHQQQDELKLIYMKARWFVPSIGRFASADTIVPDPTNPQSFNRFGYVLNNPLRYTDPSGHRNDPTAGGGVIDDRVVTVAEYAAYVLLAAAAQNPLETAKAIQETVSETAAAVEALLQSLEGQTPSEEQTSIPLDPEIEPDVPTDDILENLEDWFDNPTTPPGPDWVWKGHPELGSWYNPSTDESLRPDLAHPEPIGPHWDHIDTDGSRWRIFPDGNRQLVSPRQGGR